MEIFLVLEIKLADSRSQWFIRAAQGQLWRRNGHAEFVDEDTGEGTRSLGGSEKELVELHVANRSTTEGENTEEIEK
jgi:hypothetical protein